MLYHIPFALEASNTERTPPITWLNASLEENSYQHWVLLVLELKLSLARPYHRLGEKLESDSRSWLAEQSLPPTFWHIRKPLSLYLPTPFLVLTLADGIYDVLLID